jgi:hypothetical protein
MKNHNTHLITAGELSALEDQAAGAALTAQYRRAVSGMREVLIFGAMLMQVEAKLVQRGPVSSGGRGNKGGLREYLRDNAPEIAHATAFRFLGVTKAIAAEYEAIVGARVAKTYDLPALVLSEPDKLSEAAQAKQLELFDYVAGTSQRSWLDRFKAPRDFTLGGDTRKIDPATGERINHKRKDLDERLEIARITARDNFHSVCTALAGLLDDPSIGVALLSRQEQEDLRGALIDYGRKIREVCK